ncbi:MAG: hypothetical protein EOP45_18790, partial [Sphingobacteriaceae bacterium]
MAKKVKAPAPTDQPYYLQRAHIKDFRSIRDAVVEFKPGLNIIIGANGSGKTNFVQITSIGIDTNRNNSKMLRAEAIFKLSGRRGLEIKFHNHLEQPIVNNMIKLSDLVWQKVSIKTDDGTKGDGTTIFEALSNHKSLRFAFTDFIGPETVLINHGLPQNYVLVDELLDFKVNSFFQQPRLSDNFSRAILETFSFAITTAQYRLQIGNLSADRTRTIWHDAVNSHTSILQPLLEKYTPIEQIRPIKTSQFYDNSTRDEVVVKGLSLEFKINNNWLPFSELSSGTQRLFYIISELSVSDRYLIHELNGFTPIQAEFDKIILLEEPELGIHPHQLHLLLNFLREQSEKHQLIITTHSPQVLDMLREDELDR